MLYRGPMAFLHTSRNIAGTVQQKSALNSTVHVDACMNVHDRGHAWLHAFANTARMRPRSMKSHENKFAAGI